MLAGDEPAWYPGLTVQEHLELMHAVHGSARLEVTAALETFGLAGRRIERSPLPFGRHRWVLDPRPAPFDVVEAGRNGAHADSSFFFCPIFGSVPASRRRMLP